MHTVKSRNDISEAYFNLGNAIYEQQRFEEARESYEKALVFSKTKIEMAEVSYNIGNTFMAEKKWEDAIKYYKQSLRNNSKDLDAKYNLAYAQEMLAEEQQQQEQNKDKEDQKDGDKKEEPKEK